MKRQRQAVQDGQVLDRATYIRAAAGVLVGLPEGVGTEIAGVDTAKFVQTARPILQRFEGQIGHHYTDDDIREVHMEMRRLIGRRARRRFGVQPH